MANFTKVIKAFYKLTRKDQENLLRDLYTYSKDMKLFLDSKLSLQSDTESLIRELERETIGKIYKKGMPGTPNGKTVNAIITKAKKANVPLSVMLRLEQLAYQGFAEFLNEFGGGPDSFDEIICNHLEAYLLLIKNHVKDNVEQTRLFEEVKKYIRGKDNMITDYMVDTFEITTKTKM